MNGVTTAIVGFILLSLVFPHMIKRRGQFYAAVGAVLLIILFDTLALIVSGGMRSGPFAILMYTAIGALQIVAIILLILSAGGLSMSEFAGEMSNAFEVIRRGEDQKEVIIPLSGQKAPMRNADDDERGRVVYSLDPDVPDQSKPRGPAGPGGEGGDPGRP